MIHLKRLLFEMSSAEFNRVSKKIQSNKFRYIGSGDNARVYQIDGEDKVFKLTTSTDEIEVAKKIQNKISEYSTFIPVYYVGDLDGESTKYKNAIIMANAETLSPTIKRNIDRLIDEFKQYSYDQGGEISIFEFIENTNIKQFDSKIINFINALRVDIQKLAIPDLDLDLDFKSDNIMIWNGKLVMVDW